MYIYNRYFTYLFFFSIATKRKEFFYQVNQSYNTYAISQNNLKLFILISLNPNFSQNNYIKEILKLVLCHRKYRRELNSSSVIDLPEIDSFLLDFIIFFYHMGIYKLHHPLIAKRFNTFTFSQTILWMRD